MGLQLHQWLLRLPQLGDNAELLQYAQKIPACPALDKLASSDAIYGDPGHRHLLTRRRDASKFTQVGASGGHAIDHLISFGDLILNGEMEIGKGRIQ